MRRSPNDNGLRPFSRYRSRKTSATSNTLGPAISLAQIEALVARGLVPRGSAAHIKALLKKRGYPFSLSLPTTGKLSITWYKQPKRRRGRKIAVAKLSVSLRSIAKTPLVVKLTSAGERLLKKAKSFKVLANASFTPTGAAIVRASAKFKLKR